MTHAPREEAWTRRTGGDTSAALALREVAQPRDVDEDAAAVTKVTPADVTRVATRYLGLIRTVIVQPN